MAQPIAKSPPSTNTVELPAIPADPMTADQPADHDPTDEIAGRMRTPRR